ncbi:MAG: YbdK family carboxylate-amine ligase [Calothrix sp. MO_192.B10]|nr:YbdK family carboxylate-amine ligase [Calothrix sp. MO_192.B10]
MKDIVFNSSPTASVGMEIELQLLNSQTLELVAGILPILEQDSNYPWIKSEFNQATVEIISPVCADIPELETEMLSVLSTLKARCDHLGMTICGAGTNPICDRIYPITPVPRSLILQQDYGYLADMMITFAQHVHVGMPSGEEAIDIMARLKPYLPILLALSASSPFWWGRDTNFACYRQRFLAAMKTYGITPTFRNWQDFADFFVMGKYAGICETIRDIHWDIRPHPDFGTLEVRVMDAQPTLKESIALAALIHSLILYLRLHRQGKVRGYILQPQHWLVERENYFRASHLALDARYIYDTFGNSRPIRDIVVDILDALASTADMLGEGSYLQFLSQRLQTGASYVRQRRVFQETGSLKAVVASLVGELELDLRLYSQKSLIGRSLSGNLH